MTLAAGDIAIVGFDTDAPDTFSFVLLVAVAGGEKIIFTDNAWTGSALASNENTATWTAPAGGLAAGTVIQLADGATLSASLGSVTGTLNGLSASGDQILAYQGTAASPTFIYAANNAAVWLTTGATNSNTTYLPTGLVEGSTAVGLPHIDNYAYTGTTTGTKAELLAAIGNPLNWTSNDTAKVLHPTSFTVQSGVVLPSVTLSFSTSAGSEAGSTVITVTATASAPVTGAQTLDVSVSGTGITAGDYTLSGSTLTLADGATSGSVTFTVVDDALVEGTETATVTLGNPSSGITLGASTTGTITLSDNDAAGLLAYSGLLNEARSLDGAVSGKIVITLSGGDAFSGSPGEDLLVSGKATLAHVPDGLSAVLTRVSDTVAELSFTGQATSHANVNDVDNLGITWTDAAFNGHNAAAITGATQDSLVINFGDPGSPGTTQTFTPQAGTGAGSSDASSALALDANWMVVGDDEASVLRVYAREGGAAVVEWSYASALGNGGELDLEASTRIGDTLYFLGSHSNTKSGAEADSREYIFAVQVAGTGANTTFTYLGQHNGLEAALVAWDNSNTHGLGAGHFGFAGGSAAGLAPEAVAGFSIEGLSASQDGTQLLVAFRAPQTGTTTHEKAVIVPVVLAGLIGGSTPTFGTPVELDLGGRGIRSIEKSADGNGYLVLAGPAGAATPEVTDDFRLFRVDNTLSSATELDVSLDGLRELTGGSFESIVDVQSTASGTLVQLLQDNGDTVWPGQSLASKDLPAGQQQFQGQWVTLGAAVTDSTGPTLARATPADNASNTGVTAPLVLRFDEGVKAGAGSFVIRKTSDNSVVETIAASDTGKVSIAFNTVTIDPAADLAHGTDYYVQADATALSDHAGNFWAGISDASTLNFTTVAAASSYTLLVTELNSNASGGDFFELYNYGSTAIDLSGWKWDDDSADASIGTALGSGTLSIAPGEKIIVTNGASASALRAAWNIPATVQVLAAVGPGLGAGDAVAVFDASGHLAAALNYKGSGITASDGTVIPTATAASGLTFTAAQHAGMAFGGSNAKASAVWDGVSTTTPAYQTASVGTLGAVAQAADSTSIGSPGNVKAGTSLATAYTESFASSLGQFTAWSVDADSANTWYRASSGTAEVKGFGDTAPANDWLISKGFDLSQTTVEYLSFTTWTRYADTGSANPELRVRYSTDYPGSGNPAAYTWTELAYTASPDNSQVTTPSGLINLSAIQGSNVYFAFTYTASGTASSSASSWRLDDVKIEGYTGAVLSLAATDAAKLEGDSGTTAYTFTVTRAGSTSGTATVDYAVSGAAVTADDFGGSLPSGTVSFADGQATQLITINVSGDTTLENNEAFTVTLSNASAGTLVGASATGIIQTDDVALTLISAVQGSGSSSALNGSNVTVQAIVTAYLPGQSGFYIQEEATDQDGNVTTSEGLFVYFGTSNPGISASNVGDVIQVSGTVAEFNGLTELKTLSGFRVITDNADTSAVPAPVHITLPVASMVNWEAVEGMLVEVSSATAGGRLVVTDNYPLG